MAKVKSENTAEKRLESLFKLQLIDSKIDKIRQVRGELPLEVEDLEDEVAGLETRITKIKDEVKELEGFLSDKKNLIKDALAAINKYEEQQKNVRNNREFDALSKEIEFQTLEIELAEKRMKEADEKITNKKELVAESEEKLSVRAADLASKKKELESIISETKKEEEDLTAESKKSEKDIDERLLKAYKRVRTNMRNGLGVVAVERDACGGCFNKIPPQRQLDIRMRKKIIVCEHCGRILVDGELAESVADNLKV
jgi:hypothetical protein